MKSSQILKRVRRHLWDGKGRDYNDATYICDLLSKDTLFAGEGERNRALLKGEIGSRLGYLFSLREWLREQSGVLLADLTPTNVQAHRKAWLTQLIAEYEAKGD